MTRREHHLGTVGDDTKYSLSQPIAENCQEVNLSQHALIIGGPTLADILPSTAPRADTWNGHAYQQSILTFWSRVEPNSNGCWIWTGSRDKQNYGRWGSPYWNGIHAHRVAWEMLRGMPAPRSSGLELDHKCHTNDPSCYGGAQCPHRPCVNPDHMQEITRSANSKGSRYLLKTHCVNGHERNEATVYVNPRTGQRTCKQCVREATERWLDRDGNRERQNEMRNQRRAS